MRVAIISPFMLRLRRGNERVTRHLAVEFARSGVQTNILTWSGPIAPGPMLSTVNINVHIMPPIRYFEAFWAQWFYAQKLLLLRPDIVIIFFAGHGEAVPLTWLDRYLRPVITFVVTYPYNQVSHRFDEFKEKNFHPHLDSIVVIARHMQGSVEAFFDRQVNYIPIGVDVEYFRVNSRLPDPYPVDDKSKLLTVAALERRKGFDLILAALPNVVARLGPVNYTIVGDGPDRAWLEAEVLQRHLKDCVELVGSVDDVRPYLTHADLFLLPSCGEGLPNAYLEALAMGLPTIVSNEPPYDDIARPEFSVHVDRNNPEAMTQAIVQLLSNPVRCSAMSRAARHEAETGYAWPKIAQEYLKLFADLIQTRPNKHLLR